MFVGIMNTDFSSFSTTGVYAATGSQLSIASGRLSYALGLQGPAVAIDTACSSALVALDSSMHSLLSGACCLAVVAAANMLLSPATHLLFAKAGMLSPDGRCKTFDSRANGYTRAEGVGAVVAGLQGKEEGEGAGKLIVGGCAVRSDGRSASLTAPNGSAQASLLVAAARRAGMRAELIENHGTGTPLGDPVEMGALSQAVGEGAGVCLNSVKAHLGHTEPAAGLVGLQQLMQLLLHRSSVNAQLRQLNPLLSPLLQGMGARVATQLHSVGTSPSTGGVSSFGYSGTISHALLQMKSEPLRSPAGGASPLVYRRYRFAWVERPHAFAQQLLPASASEERIFRSPAQGALLRMVSEHVVRGRVVFPAAGYLEMASAVASKLGGGGGLGDVFFVSPFFVEQQHALECVVTGQAFKARSLDLVSEGEPTIHCMGKLTQPTSPPQLSPASNEERDVSEIYKILHHAGLEYGPAYRRLRQVWAGQGAYTAWLHPRGSRQGMGVHPADVDACLQLVVLPTPSEPTLRLPYSVKEATLLSGRRRMALSAQMRASGWDLQMTDSRGERVASLGGVVARALGSQAPTMPHLYTTEWVPAPALPSPNARSMLLLGEWTPSEVLSKISSTTSPSAVALRVPAREKAAGDALCWLQIVLELAQTMRESRAADLALWIVTDGASTARESHAPTLANPHSPPDAPHPLAPSS